MRGSIFHDDVKPLTLAIYRENPDYGSEEVLAVLRQEGYDPLPRPDTVRKWRRQAGINPPPGERNGFCQSYREKAVRIGAAVRSYRSLLIRLGPDIRGKKPCRDTLRLWLKSAGVELGQNPEPPKPMRKTGPLLKPVRVDSTEPEAPSIPLQYAGLELVDPDLYAGAIDPMLRNLWARLHVDKRDEPWIVLRMWACRPNGDRAFKVIPSQKEPFIAWAQGTAGFIAKMESFGYRVLMQEERRIAA